jgi:hypothetical protein
LKPFGFWMGRHRTRSPWWRQQRRVWQGLGGDGIKCVGPRLYFALPVRDNDIQNRNAFCTSHPNRKMHTHFALHVLELALLYRYEVPISLYGLVLPYRYVVPITL